MTTDRFSFLRRPALPLAVGLAVVAALAWLVFAGGTAKRTEGERWVAVRAAPLVHQIGLVGRLEPGRVVTLAAPFAGNVEALLVEPGQRVAEGQELLRMDTREIAVQVREAQSALLKARRTLQDLRDWERGEDMARVRRALRSAQLAQSSTERKLRETRELFQRGIVPRNELDDLEQQASQQRMDLEAARREVESTRAKGQGENRQIAEMDLANASVKYETLQAHWMAVRCARPLPVSSSRRPAWLASRAAANRCRPVASWAGPGVVRPGQRRAAEGICEGFRTGYQPVTRRAGGGNQWRRLRGHHAGGRHRRPRWSGSARHGPGR